MKELADGLFQLRGFPRNAINVYLVGDVLIDAGTRRAGRRILGQVSGRSVTGHALTHAHPDHQGASHEVCERLRLPLWCGELDADAVETGNVVAAGGGINSLIGRIWAGPPHPVARRLHEGDTVAGFTVLDTPGHSAGHVSYWRESDRMLICGDVFFGLNMITGIPGLHEPPAQFTPDVPRNRESMRRLAALEPELLCFRPRPAAPRPSKAPGVHEYAARVTLARGWHRANSFHHSEFPPERLAERRSATVSICLPARNEARTIRPILEQLIPLRERGVVDQVVVVDQSTDGTGEIATRLGAEVHDAAELMPELGPVLGKGDKLWRALPILHGEIVCFLDADSELFGAHFACGLVGPLLLRTDVSFVKGHYRRPFRVGSTTLPDGGGRVTELTARPLINLFYPDLAGVEQPLAGEVAARRELLERVPFATGYGVDIALLLDAYAAIGLDGLAQVDLDVRQNAHQPLRDLGPMASAVLGVVVGRLEREGRFRGQVADQQLERPPHVSLRAAA